MVDRVGGLLLVSRNTQRRREGALAQRQDEFRLSKPPDCLGLDRGPYLG